MSPVCLASLTAAVRPNSLSNSQKTFYKPFFTTWRPILYTPSSLTHDIRDKTKSERTRALWNCSPTERSGAMPLTCCWCKCSPSMPHSLPSARDLSSSFNKSARVPSTADLTTGGRREGREGRDSIGQHKWNQKGSWVPQCQFKTTKCYVSEPTTEWFESAQKIAQLLNRRLGYHRGISLRRDRQGRRGKGERATP